MPFSKVSKLIAVTLSATLVSLPVFADMTLVLLGTGTPNPVPERAGAASAVIVDGQPWIIDAGPGVVRRVEATRRAGVKALTQPNLSRALLTHLHSDHTLGLPDLMYAPWTLEREVPLKVWGPKGVSAMVGHLEKAFSEDVHNRINGAEPANETGWRIEATDIEAGILYDDGSLVIEAISACHGDWKQAFAYKFSHQGQSILISGDTTYCPAVEAAARGVDILLHEVYDAEALARRSEEWQNYHRAAHTSGPDLGKLAGDAKPKHLVLHHQLVWSGSREAVMAQVDTGFSGKTTWGEDLMVFDLSAGH